MGTEPMDKRILDMIREMKEVGASREAALTITKLQEALFWYREHEETRKQAVKSAGVGIV